MDSLPVVDFSSLALDNLSLKSTELDQLSSKLIDAFESAGFVYFINHGISQNKVDDIHALGKELFSLPLEIKMKYPREKCGGYVNVGQESANQGTPGDLKECFTVTPFRPETMFPNEVVNCKNRIIEFHQMCWKPSHRILLAIAHGLGLSENIFEQSHTYEKTSNKTALRFLHYPPLPRTIKPNQIRIGEHCDFGTITLLFQDDIGGIEVKHPNGEWVPARPLPGAILVNIGDFLQRWSADKLISAPHRIRVPEEEFRRKSSRYSIAYFVNPDDEYLVECLDNSNKYPPVRAGDYLMQKLVEMFK